MNTVMHPKEAREMLHGTLTKSLGSAYTMRSVYVLSLSFMHNGKRIPMSPSFTSVTMTWGEVIGYLLWALQEGVTEVRLITMR